MDWMHGRVFGEMTDEFEFEETGMNYVDGPLSGWLRRKSDHLRFAYFCQSIIVDRLFHWTLVSAPNTSIDPVEVLADAAKASGGSWLSIIEDRRVGPTSTCHAAEVRNEDARPVAGGADCS